jgi:hypothetical protein
LIAGKGCFPGLVEGGAGIFVGRQIDAGEGKEQLEKIIFP